MKRQKASHTGPSTTGREHWLRLALASGVLAAIAAVPAFAVPSSDLITPAAPCPNGEEVDVFSLSCTPHLAPRSPLQPIPGNPDVPAIRGVPCTTEPECTRLGRKPGILAPQPVPHAKFGHEGTAESHP